MTDEQVSARVTQAEYGRMRNMSRQRVNQLVGDGRIPLDNQGLVDVQRADANLASMLDRHKATRERLMAIAISELGLVPAAEAPAPIEIPAPPPAQLELEAKPAEAEEPAASAPTKAPEDRAIGTAAASDYWQHKARREQIEADRAELAYRKAIGNVVDVDEVAKSRRETAYKVANALQQIPARISPVICPQDPQRAERAIAEEINRVINELAGDLDRAAGAVDAERDRARAA